MSTSPDVEPIAAEDGREVAAPSVPADPPPDAVIALPWWQNPVNIVTMLVTIALLAGMVGWLVGQSANEVESSDVDTGFLQDMRVHHEQAIDMSRIFLERPDTAGGLRTVAGGIQLGQSIEIGIMVQLLVDMDAPTEGEEGQAMAWMGMPMAESDMPGMATDEQLEALAASSGAEADRLFVELMTAHHRGGVEMLTEAAERAANGDVRRYASAWASSQSEEITELERLQADLADPTE